MGDKKLARQPIPRWLNFVFGGLSGVQNSEKGIGQFQVLSTILKEEGVFALWRGFIPTYAKLGPLTVLIFIFMEQWNALFYRLTE